MQGTIYHQGQASLNIVLTDTQTHKIGANIPFLQCCIFFSWHTDINSDAVHTQGFHWSWLQSLFPIMN